MRIILIIFFIYIKEAQSQVSPGGNEDQAISREWSTMQAVAYTQRAILALPEVKSKVKMLERRLIHYIPLEREYVITTGSIGMAIIRGRVETRPIKNFEVDFMGGRARPDIFYNFRGEDKGAYFNITWGF